MELKCELEGGGACPDYLILKSGGSLGPRPSSDTGALTSLLSPYTFLSFFGCLLLFLMSNWTFQGEARKDEFKVSFVSRMSRLVIKSQ